MHSSLLRKCVPSIAAVSLSGYFLSNFDAEEASEAPLRFFGSVSRRVAWCDADSEDLEVMTNWSATHSVELRKVYSPESVEELTKLVQASSNKIRPVGSALSPNGLSFAPPNTSCISMSLLDKVLSVDTEGMTVTVQGGARVERVIEELRQHNLTLPNLASIAEQQVGGFVNAGAHGTGATVPPVDDFVLSMKLVTPAFGVIEVKSTDSGMNKVSESKRVAESIAAQI
jgi:FAD/FMN-containing dehydrogenase